MGAKRSRRDAEEVPADGLTPDRGTPLVRSEEEHGGKQRKQRSNLIALHRARFVEWEPTAAVASGASGDGTVLAVARESGDVELWNADHWSCITVRCSSLHCTTTDQAALLLSLHPTHLSSRIHQDALCPYSEAGRLA